MNRTSRIAFAAAACLILSCGSRYDNICTIQNDCVGGNDADYEACIASYDAQDEQASIYGCEEDADAAFEACDASIECDDEVVQVDDDCGDSLADVNECICDNSDLCDD